ncbi:MAG: type II secretion system F family protein [Thermoguttaceae bacterium]
MSPLLIAVAVFVGVTALVGSAAFLFSEPKGSRLEKRLDAIRTGTTAKPNALKQASVLMQPLNQVPGLLEKLLSRFGNFEHLLQQADTPLTLSRLGLISLVMASLGAAGGILLRMQTIFIPVLGLSLGCVPVLWILYRRKRRLRAFGVQLPDALEMLSRSLRGGQSLGSGFSIVASEMGPPLGKEFGRVFEEQNLGVALDESLDSLTERIPDLDLRFFATAVVLQRQTGGDLAEILDKLGRLIRERFQIRGQVRALTGEGRLSGIILLALPVVLVIAVYQLNPEYISTLFTDPLGKKMVGVALFLQLLGALVIRKIVNIKV